MKIIFYDRTEFAKMPSNSVVKDTLVVGGLSLLGFLAGGKLGSMFGNVL